MFHYRTVNSPACHYHYSVFPLHGIARCTDCPALSASAAVPGVPLSGRAVVNGASQAVSALAGFHP
ncbi:TPA: hypothetical protein ACWV7H_004881 [Salmonella enterica subsp. enterica serovar Muenchen]